MSRKAARRPLDKKVAAELLFKNNHCCCVCRRGVENGARIQLHHINGDPSDNRPENIAVLCSTCHDRTSDKPFMAKGLLPDEIRMYKKDWEETVAETRKRLRSPATLVKETITERIDEQGRVEKLTMREVTCFHNPSSQIGYLSQHIPVLEQKTQISGESGRIILT